MRPPPAPPTAGDDLAGVLGDEVEPVRPVLDAAQLKAVREEVVRVTFSEELMRYVVDLAIATRNAPELTLGASPRGEVLLLLASKAAAAFEEDDRLKEIRVDAATCGCVVDQRPEARGPLRRYEHTARTLRIEDMREPKSG